ncbi:hypothetical protein F5B22DRAFT_662487 [Xylaria bambusicola]|uniref:uncharacterized protein n=1 Tax=Xylaria bambusicola TaxID=326684 RepID=UPI002007CCC5|nr:uncharacterized protein F5B22DRAFT_662487 [Xylaria bambusicola]KAI0521371.1 hypothetical protein F5B22DRAFT_662487 [Xylaria bambusicola]
MAIKAKATLALVVATAASLANAQFGPLPRECTFTAYTSTDCSGESVPKTVPHYADCWVAPLQSYKLEGPECYAITVEAFADQECGFPNVYNFAEAHPITRAGCYNFATNPQSGYFFFRNC